MREEIIKRSNKYGIVKYFIDRKYELKNRKQFETLDDMFKYNQKRAAIDDILFYNDVINRIDTIESIEDLKEATLNYVTDEDRELLLKYIKLANEIIDKNIVETKDFSYSKIFREKIDRYLKENDVEI